jgi:predicted DCC family thiol-disulfide oxidoreductase YuxK
VGSRSILLFDGVCGLCNRAVQFALRHDRRDRLRFAALESRLAKEVLARHGLDGTPLQSMVLVVDAGTAEERALVRSEAALRLLSELGGVWRWIASLGRLVPLGLRDRCYRAVADVRYRVFGRYESCPVPRPEDGNKFLDT